MIHAAWRLLAAQPAGLANHLDRYGLLLAAEATQAAAALRRRAWLAVGAVLGAGLGLALGGAALLLLAAVPLPNMPQPWLLALVPALPLALAAACGAALAWPQPGPLFPALRQQLANDAQHLRQAEAERAGPSRPGSLPQQLFETVDAGLAPLARQHPIALAGLAAAVGALLVATRPWRWALVAAGLRSLPRHARRWLLREARALPWESLLATALAALAEPGRPQGGAASPAGGSGGVAGNSGSQASITVP